MTTEKFVMAIDQGTTSTRAIIFNHSGEIVSVGQKEFTQIFPNPGWVEHDPMEIWGSVRTVVAEALQKAEINRHQLAAVGITNQRETTVVWDKNTGEPVYNAIVWQDMRTSDFVKELEGDEGPDRFRQICGLGLSPYFSGSKIKWILDNVEGARERAEAGDLYFGNTDSWVLWNLTGGVNGGVHYTDVTNASRTMLMDIRTLQWREDVCEIFGIPMSMLPEIKSSSEIYGYGRKNGLLIDTPISGILGDQQAATFGQACFEKGMAKNTYGTGCFMLMNTGTEPVFSNNGLLTTVAYKIGDQAPVYALEGSIAVGAGALHGLGFGDNAKAAIITRGLAEITRLGVKLGANPLTYSGLSGVGDLIVTGTSVHSRNWRAGDALGRGEALADIEANMGMVIEGISTTKAAYELAQELEVYMPITQAIYQVIYENVNIKDAVAELMSNEFKSENEWS